MTDQDLMRKIKELRKIQPSCEWKDSARHNLLNRARLSDNANNVESGLSFWGWFKQFQAVALAICLLVNIILGPWLIIKAASSSLPGELLYSIKKASEQVQSKVASEDTRSQLQVEFAKRRIEELNKIAEKYSSEIAIEEAERKKTKKVISDFKNSLADASLYLKNNISKEKAVVVAKQTKKIEEDLVKAKEEASAEVQAELAEAEKTIDDIKHQILAVLTQEDSDQLTATSTDEEILIFLQEETGTTTAECSKAIDEILEAE